MTPRDFQSLEISESPNIMEMRSRTLMKTLSWRFIATIITGTLGWLFTGKAAFGLTIGLADTCIKCSCIISTSAPGRA